MQILERSRLQFALPLLSECRNGHDGKLNNPARATGQSERKTMKNTLRSAAIVCLLTSDLALAAVIDFEQINMTVPYEGMVISNQFEPYYGVRFRRNATGSPYPVIARVGAPLTAFDRNSSAPGDTPTDAYTNLIGNFMLTDTVGDQGGGASEQLILEYVSPVSRASGYILDIDGSETVYVVAYSDTNGVDLLTNLIFTAGQAGTGDGVATFWQIARPTKEIRRVDIHNNGHNVGYDLFDSDYAPINSPPQLTLRTYPGLVLQGTVGHRYQIDYADRLDVSGGNTNWHTLTSNLFLPTPSYLYFDTNGVGSQRFYRAGALP